MAGRGTAGQVAPLAVLPRVLPRALAPVAAHLVAAHPAVPARRGALGALVDVLPARLAGEGGRALADVVRVEGHAAAAVGAGAGGAGVRLLARFPWRGERGHMFLGRT